MYTAGEYPDYYLTGFNLENNYADSVIYQNGYMDAPGLRFEDDIALGDGVSVMDLDGGMYVTVYYKNPNVTIVGYEELPPIPVGDGSLERPYNVEQALAVAALYDNNTNAPVVYCFGTVSRVGESVGTAGDIKNVYISDGRGHEILIYYLKKFENAPKASNFSSVDDLPVGTELVICGKPFTYSGNTPEFANGTFCVTIDGVPTNP